MRSHKTELIIPPTAQSDKNAREVVRAWIAHGGLHCSIDPVIWSNEQGCIGWGILLSDIARHVADALHKESGLDKQQTLQAIRKTFDEEIQSPTAETKGEFLH